MSKTLLERMADTVDPARRRFIEKQGEIATRLGRLLDELNMTQQELADRTGLKRSYINRLLHGGGNITLKTLTRLEAALGHDLIAVPLSVEKRSANPSVNDESRAVSLPVVYISIPVPLSDPTTQWSGDYQSLIPSQDQYEGTTM